MTRIAAARGVRDVRLNERTANVLIQFDEELIDEPRLLALISDEPPRVSAARSPSAGVRPAGNRRVAAAPGPPESGWLRAKRSETIGARPAECVAALLDFERYPEWQAYVTRVEVLERDERGRGVRVAIAGDVADRQIRFTAGYRFPSPNRVFFEQEDGELDAVRGSWMFRSLGGGRTRATHQLDVKPGWRMGLMLRGPLYEQIREAALDHLMGELRVRVEKN